MAQKKSSVPHGVDFILFYRCVFRGLDRQVKEYKLLPRGGRTSYDMCKSMSSDLTPLGIPWEIRDGADEVTIYEQFDGVFVTTVRPCNRPIVSL